MGLKQTPERTWGVLKAIVSITITNYDGNNNDWQSTYTHWSSDLILWQCDNFWITRKPQIMTLRLLIWKGSVMISPSSQGQLMEDQINGQRVCLPSLVFTVGLFVASRGRFLSRGRFFLVGGAARWNRVVGAPILLRSSTRPPTFPSRRSWGSHPWHCDQYHLHQHHQKDHQS